MSIVHYTDLKPNLGGFYIGIVVDNYDPENMGRVKCSIKGLLDIDEMVDPSAKEGSGIPRTRDEAIDSLPWVYKLSPSFTGSTGVSGLVSIPNVGARVVIQFPNQDIYFPVYFGVIQDKMDYTQKYNKKISENADTADKAHAPPHLTGRGKTAHGFVTSSGTQVSIDDLTGQVCIWHPSSTWDFPTQIKITPDGSVLVSSSKEVTVSSGRDLNLSAAHAINLTAPYITLDAAAKVRIDSSNVSSRGLVLSDNGSSGAVVGINGVVAAFTKGALSGLR